MEQRCAFLGLDLYSTHRSILKVLEFLDKKDPQLAAEARERYSRLLPLSAEPEVYAMAVMTGFQSVEKEVTEELKTLLANRLELSTKGGVFGWFNATENARVVKDSEQYYRQMYYGELSTWNLRDHHMMHTLESVSKVFNNKVVVWAHNSHLGDAQYTEMSARGEINLGHLCRQKFGDKAFLIGFGTHTGTVMAAHSWGSEGEVQDVRPSLMGSHERLMHETGVPRFMLSMRHLPDKTLIDELSKERLERAIGVVYKPNTERHSHYFGATLTKQFDEWIFIDETRAVTPLWGEKGSAPELPRFHPFSLMVD